MKAIRGNNPKCVDCFYYEEVDGKKEWYDGRCHNFYQCTHGVNGRKLDRPRDFYPVRWNDCCRQWEDAENRVSLFEFVTGIAFDNSSDTLI